MLLVIRKKERKIMKRTCKVNGKVSYPQNDGVLTTFSFHNPETGEVYAMSTTSQEETDELNYGDTVTLEIKKSVTETPEETEVSE
jgi:betaine-aldehyde dehydrogenase